MLSSIPSAASTDLEGICHEIKLLSCPKIEYLAYWGIVQFKIKPIVKMCADHRDYRANVLITCPLVSLFYVNSFLYMTYFIRKINHSCDNFRINI